MCPHEGKLQAFLDGELTAREMAVVEAHLASCAACRRRLLRLEENGRFAAARLIPYLNAESGRSGAGEAPAVEKRNRPGAACGTEGAAPAGGRANILRGVVNWMGRYRNWAVAAALVLALSVAMCFSSVRGFAGELLTVFRVEQVQAVTIDPQDMAQLQKILASGNGRVDVNNLGRFEVSGKPRLEGNVTLAEAQKEAGFSVRLPAAPPGCEPPRLSVLTGSTIKLTLDTEKANALLRSLGGGELLPDSLNGRVFSIQLPACVLAEYRAAGGGGRSIVVAQERSPELIVPPGTDVESVRRALLAVPGLPENLRRQLAAVSDWQHTLPVPVPQGSARQVAVNGVPGLFIRPAGGGAGADNTALIWQQGGFIRFIGGPQLALPEALSLAAQMQ